MGEHTGRLRLEIVEIEKGIQELVEVGAPQEEIQFEKRFLEWKKNSLKMRIEMAQTDDGGHGGS